MSRRYPTYRLGPDFRHRLGNFVEKFIADGYAEFSREFANLGDFICQAKALPDDHEEKNIRTTPKEKYLLEAVSFKIYDNLNRKAFNKTKDTLIVLPDCLSLNNPDCERFEGEFGDECAQCSQSCQSYWVMELAAEHGARVVFAKRKLTEQIEHWAGKLDNIGVIGVACIVMLGGGMRTSYEAGIPARGVLLSFTGCEHWNDAPFGSRFPTSWLKEILEEKRAARTAEADH